MKLKKFTAAVLACAVAAGVAAGCTLGSDTSWCAKNANLTLPGGVYIFDLYSAYSEGQSKTSTADMKKAKIENKDAMTWVTERAKVLTNELFVLNDDMKKYNLSFTTDETTAIKQAADSAWSQQFSSALSSKDVSSTSFRTAYAQFIYEERKVFQAIYDKGGSKAISESELQSNFEKNYTDLDFTYVTIKESTFHIHLK